MIRSRGLRLASRSLALFLIHNSGSSLLCDYVLNGGCRSFSTALCNQSRGRSNSYFGNVGSEKYWLKLGFFNGNFGAARSIHDTGLKSYFLTSLTQLSKDFYEVLGVNKNATSSEIKKAYYGLANKLHPDTNKDDPETEKKFQEVQKACEILKDDEKRQQYDQLGHEAFESASNGAGPGSDPFGGAGFNPFQDIFRNADIFNIFNRDMGGEDVKVSVELSFMEAVQGCTKTISIMTDFSCDTFGGTGVPPGTKPETCKRCRRSGMIVQQNGPFTLQSTCPNCGGAGKIVLRFCKSCKGKRVVRGSKTVKLNFMAGKAFTNNFKKTTISPFSGSLRSYSGGPFETFSGETHPILQSSRLQHWFKNWQHLRKNKLTASTFGLAIGFWPRGRARLWLEKLEAIEPFSGNLATCWSNIKEEEALERYKLITGNTVIYPEFQVYDKDDYKDNWLAASPDGAVHSFCYELPTHGVLEIKCPFFGGDMSRAYPWKRVPLYYIPQAQGLMEILDRDWMDMYVWTINGSSLFRIYRDKEYWDLLKVALSDFWFKHVEPAKEVYDRSVMTNPLVDLRKFRPAPKHEMFREIVNGSKLVVDNSRLLMREIHGKLQI